MYDQGKLKSGKADFRWCILTNDYALSLYKKRGDKVPDRVLLVPGNIIQYGDDELKTDKVVPIADRKKVKYV